jgi:hypothetical protein
MFGRSKIVEQLKAHGASLQQRNRFGISSKWMVGILAVNGLAGTRGDVFNDIGDGLPMIAQLHPALGCSQKMRIRRGQRFHMRIFASPVNFANRVRKISTNLKRSRERPIVADLVGNVGPRCRRGHAPGQRLPSSRSRRTRIAGGCPGCDRWRSVVSA